MRKARYSPGPVSNRIKHEFVVVPAERCAALDEQVDELRRAEAGLRAIPFTELPGYYHALPSWRALARHLLPGARRSWSRDGLATHLCGALAARVGGEWRWLEATATLLPPDEAMAAAGALAELVRDADGPRAAVMDGLARAVALSDEQRVAWPILVAAELASPNGADHGDPGDFVELLRNLCAAAHDAGTREGGLLYLCYDPALAPT